MELLEVILLLPVFIILAIWAFFFPGLIFISKAREKLSPEAIISLSFSLGVIIFVLLASLLGLIGLRELMIPLFVVLDLAAIWLNRRYLIPLLRKFLQDRLLLLLLFLGIIVLGAINFPSGFTYSESHLYWSAQGLDGLWHVSLMEEIKQNFPPNNPLFAGEKLFNYHYLVDVLMGDFARIFPFFTTLDLYFRYFPILFAFLIGLSVYSLAMAWKGKKAIGYWTIFFTYFAGSFGYLVHFIKTGSPWGGETSFWAAQINTILGNPPHAAGCFLLPSFFLAFWWYLKSRKLFWWLISFALGAFLVGFKVSAGAVLLAGIITASVVDFFMKKTLKTSFLALCLILSNAILFKITTRAGESLLIFQPWWLVRTIIIDPNRVGWLDLEWRRQHYLAKGTWHSLFRVVQLEATAFLMYLVGNLGMRVIGFFEIAKEFLGKRARFTPFNLAFLATCFAGFIPTLIFIQKGHTFNFVQFMQYFLLFFGFYAAMATDRLLSSLKSKRLKYFFAFLIISLSIPTVIGNMVEFYGRSALAIVSSAEIEALGFLRNNSLPSDVILTKPFDRYTHGQYKKQPWPIYSWFSTSYVNAYTSRPTYLTGEGQGIMLGLDTETRLKKMNDFFDPELSLEDKQGFLKSEMIEFVYLRTEEADEEQREILSQLNLKQIFENEEVVIYQVD